MRRRLPLLALAVLCALPVLSHAAPLASRFAPRAYFSGERRIPVGTADDALALRAAPATDPRTLALLVEAAALKATAATGDTVLIAEARRLRSHGLFVVEFGDRVSRATLLAITEELKKLPQLHSVHPVLTRMTGRAFTDERLVLTAEPGKLDTVLRTALEKTGGILVRETRVPNTVLIAVGAALDFDAVEASRLLQGTPGLLSAEPDLYREYELTATVDDPLHANQWHLHRPGANQPVPGTGQIFAHEAWDTTKGSPDVIVAVFDSGTDVDHEDLAPNIVPGFDPSAGDDDPRNECSASYDGDDEATGCPVDRPYMESHGTAVSGVIAAKGDNALGLSGVCPNCKLMPVRLLGDQVGSGLSTAESFIRAVDDGAWVINNSWGPGRSRYFPMSMAERTAFDHARTTGRGGLGTVIVFAAGNSRANVASDPYASHPFAIAVAASSNLDDWVSYSNYGNEIDIAAPSLGGTINEDNHGIWTTDVTGANGYVSDSYTPEFSGTSASSPVVAGVAGLILSANPALTAEQVRLVITRSADPIRADKIDWAQIFGQDLETLFEYDENGHSIAFGWGRVNAGAAVTLALNPGVIGGPCDAEGCEHCSTQNRCLTECTTQADCPGGTFCEEGLCELPHQRPGDLGAPCSSECDHCTSALDTEFEISSLCTIECQADVDCPTGFDCRIIDDTGLGICAVGSRAAGERDSASNCRSDLFGSALTVSNGLGQSFCTDMCFGDEPGGCPYGFHCGGARCQCTSMSNFGFCRSYQCVETQGQGTWDTPLCFADPSFGDTCTSDVNCPPGDYCTAEGRCRTDDRQGCSVCQECQSNEDCGAGSVCRFQRNGPAYCTRGCYVDADCPGDSVCREVTSRSTVSRLCFSPSEDPQVLCAADYSCKVACREDVPCGEGEMCEDGNCVPAPPDAGMPTADAGPQTTEPPAKENPPTTGIAVPGCASTSVRSEAMPLLGLALLTLAVARRRRR